MKSIIQKTASVLFALFVLVSLTNAQAPDMFNYQAVARNAAGSVLSNQSIGIQFTVLDGSSTGTPVYQETQTATTNSLGLFTASIGGGTVVSGTIAGVNWGSGSKYLEVQIDPTGGTTYTVTGTSQLLSVPYAIYAANGGGTGGGVTSTGGAPFIPLFTGTSTLANSALQETNGGAIWLGGQSPAIGNSLFSITGGSVTGHPADALFATKNLANGSNIYAQNNSGTTTALFENDGQGPGLMITANNSAYAFQINDYAAGIAGNAFAGFGNGGNADLVVINETVNGHGQIAFVSDTEGTQTAQINCNLTGLVTAINGNAITQTGLNSSNYPYLAPYTSNETALGQVSNLWSVVCATNGMIQTSDSRLKENIKPLSYGLNTVMQLSPVSYNWKNKRLQMGTGTNLGFLAQDVEKIIPDVIVHEVNSDAEIAKAKKDKGVDLEKDTYGVKYAEFTPVLVKAIQEQQQMIADLQKQVQELTSKINSK